MRSVLNKVQLSALALGLAVGGVVACGDDPAPTNNNQENPSTGDGDGDTSNTGDGDNGTGDGDDNGQCQTGASQECTCDDGVTQGQQICAFGSFGSCTGCPCTDGANQACTCPEGGLGSQTCSAGSFGECTCQAVDPDAACPASTTCNQLGGEAVQAFAMGATLPTTCNVETDFIITKVPAPPPCTADTDCEGLGFASSTQCLENPFAFGGLLPAKVCLQTCVDPNATTPAP